MKRFDGIENVEAGDTGAVVIYSQLAGFHQLSRTGTLTRELHSREYKK